MEELLALLERYVPGYRDRIKGVYDWELDELQDAFGQPLPGFYREFARVMGQDGGPLLEHVHVYEPLEIAELYQLDTGEMLPRRFLYVFGDPSIDAQHYWLDLEARSEGEDCLVARSHFGGEAWKKFLVRRFISLREMLFVWAMTYVRLPVFPHRAEYLHRALDEGSEEPTDVEELARVFERLGFLRLPYPSHCLLFERENASIKLYRPPEGSGFSFEVGMRDEGEFRRFQAIAEDIPDLVRW